MRRCAASTTARHERRGETQKRRVENSVTPRTPGPANHHYKPPESHPPETSHQTRKITLAPRAGELPGLPTRRQEPRRFEREKWTPPMHEHPNRLHKVACQLASVLLGAGLLTSAIATPSHAVTPPNKMGAHPTWGTCGLTSSQMKLVYDFGAEVLYCGSASSFGYLHIKAGKQTSFAPLAAAVGRTWEDLLWFSIAWAQNDPDASRYNPAKREVLCEQSSHSRQQQRPCRFSQSLQNDLRHGREDHYVIHDGHSMPQHGRPTVRR